MTSAALAALLAGAAAPAVYAGAVGAPTVSSLLAASGRALKDQHGVHLVLTTDRKGVRSSAVADIGRSAGHESYTSGAERFDVAVTTKAAYLSGSPSGLRSLMGLNAAQAAKVGAKWIVMKKGSTQYKEFWLNLTAKGFGAILPSAKGTRLLGVRDATTGGYQLRWTTPKSATASASTTTLVIASGSRALPLRELVAASGATSLTVFSHWGESVRFPRPSATIAYAKVFG
ncbi:MAG: hypothetical protein B7Z69_01930 [Actinobacteria bacterium 21-73-9]|nr:MAG: hypothetical protein B7Z69_01930 [Actinobacteria bacterium 21-73-9]